MTGSAAPFVEVDAFVGLGSNVGDRLAALQAAVVALGQTERTHVLGVSPVYETEAHVLPGQAPQPDHLNAVAHLATTLGPLALLRRLHAVEDAAGRDRAAERWSPRPLDLDLLLYGAVRQSEGGLTLPHPRLSERRFVLQPLADLAPDLVVPGLGRTVAGLLDHTPDRARLTRTGFVIGPLGR